MGQRREEEWLGHWNRQLACQCTLYPTTTFECSTVDNILQGTDLNLNCLDAVRLLPSIPPVARQGCIQDFFMGRGGTHIIAVASRESGGMLPQNIFCILRWTLT